jgi:hypothetical protein
LLDVRADCCKDLIWVIRRVTFMVSILIVDLNLFLVSRAMCVRLVCLEIAFNFYRWLWLQISTTILMISCRLKLSAFYSLMFNSLRNNEFSDWILKSLEFVSSFDSWFLYDLRVRFNHFWRWFYAFCSSEQVFVIRDIHA